MNDRTSTVPATGKKTLWAWVVGTFFGAGMLKPGPGTWGSVAAMLLWMATAYATKNHWFSFPLSPGQRIALSDLAIVNFSLFLVATVFGIPAATRVAEESGREDPGHVVIDEVAGQWLTLVVCKPDWPHALLALALFRLFDITKPWPIRRLEALPGGWGIMLDDLGAGFLAMVTLVIIQHWW